MKRVWPIIAVADVRASAKWYMALLAASKLTRVVPHSIKSWTTTARFLFVCIIGVLPVPAERTHGLRS